MKWYKNLYVGDSLKGKEKQMKSLISHDMVVPFGYVITLPANETNLMDVIEAKELRKKGYPKDSLSIIGLASDKGEALELVRRIIDEVYHETGQLNIRDYLLNRYRNSKKAGTTGNKEDQS